MKLGDVCTHLFRWSANKGRTLRRYLKTIWRSAWRNGDNSSLDIEYTPNLHLDSRSTKTCLSSYIFLEPANVNVRAANSLSYFHLDLITNRACHPIQWHPPLAGWWNSSVLQVQASNSKNARAPTFIIDTSYHPLIIRLCLFVQVV